MSKPKDVVQGTLDLLILKILALEPMHGWAISQRLKQVSGEILQVSDGSLYPARYRFEPQGQLVSDTGQTETNPPATYNRLTPAGRTRVREEAAGRTRLVMAIGASMDATPAEV